MVVLPDADAPPDAEPFALNDAGRAATAGHGGPRLTTRRRLAFSLLVFSGSLATIVAGAEAFARLKGFRPWAPSQDRPMRVQPAGGFGTPDADLGHAYLPGQFTVTLADGYSFRMTQGEDGLRITRPLSGRHDAPSRGALWIFGCSYTHGWSLDDEETYPWLVQERLADYDVVNFGVGGYGTLQSLLQFRRALEKRPAPKAAVLAYGSFHDARNTLNRYRMKGVTPPTGRTSVRLPCARLGGDGALEIFAVDADHYRPWPLQRYLAFVHFLEESANRRELLRVRSHLVAKAIVDEFKRLADRHGTRLVLAGIFRSPDTTDMLRYARSEGIDSVDISVRDTPEFQNLPHDAHPNALANRRFAERLSAFLGEKLE
jgi:hypothetical protein